MRTPTKREFGAKDMHPSDTMSVVSGDQVIWYRWRNNRWERFDGPSA